MAKVVNAYRASEYSPPPPAEEASQHFSFSDFSDSTAQTAESFLAGIQDDAKTVAQALKTFPYGSALKLFGLAALLYIGFKAVRKFGNIEEKIKQALRSKP